MESDRQTVKSHYNFTPSLPNEKTYHEHILRRVAEHVANGRKEWLTDARTDFTINFEDVEKLSRKAASGFWKLGMRKGDTVIYTSHDCSLLYMLFLGIWRANGIIRAIYSEESYDYLSEKIKESKAKFVICDSWQAEGMKEMVLSIDWPVIIIAFGDKIEDVLYPSDLFEDDGENLPDVCVDGEDPALILPSSGTTGPSKGVLLSHKKVLYSVGMYEHLPFSPDPRQPVFLFGKATHATGSQFPIFQLVYGQRTITSHYSQENLFNAAHKYKAKSIFCVTPLIAPLVYSPQRNDYDLSSLEHIFVGGAVAPVALIEELYQTLPHVKTVTNFCGMTECYMIANSLEMNLERKVSNIKGVPHGSIGRICPGYEMEVRDFETKKTLGPNEKGELFFKTPLIFDYYVNNPENTKATIIDGWIATGDYGYYDENHFIYITDRVKETFLCHNGNHISPSELEAVIQQHPAVANACVIPEPYEQVGDPRGFVVLKHGFEPSCELEKEIQTFANDKLPPYKHIHGGIFILEEFPVGKSGKILRRMLAKPNKQYFN